MQSFKEMFYPTISPVVDTASFNILSVENYINNPSNDIISEETSPYVGNPNQCKARYISRRVDLPKTMGSRNINVSLSLYQPLESMIKVFVRFNSSSDEFEFLNKDYVQMEEDMDGLNFRSTTPYDFHEVTFKLPQESYDTLSSGLIKSMSVKIVMLSSNSAQYPRIRDLRLVALNA